MKSVTVTYTFQVDESVTDQEIDYAAANAYVQFTEPVVGCDPSGNDIESDFGHVTYGVEIDGPGLYRSKGSSS